MNFLKHTSPQLKLQLTSFILLLVLKQRQQWQVKGKRWRNISVDKIYCFDFRQQRPCLLLSSHQQHTHFFLRCVIPVVLVQ